MGHTIRIANYLLKTAQQKILNSEWNDYLSEFLFEQNKIENFPLGSGVLRVNSDLELPELEEIFHDAEQGPDELYEMLAIQQPNFDLFGKKKEKIIKDKEENDILQVEVREVQKECEKTQKQIKEDECDSFNLIEFWRIDIKDQVIDLDLF